MPKITPFLWFDKNAEEAANFYVSVFKNSKIVNVVRAPAGAPNPEGSAMVVEFELDGTRFTALNAGPHFKFTEAISFVVHCKDQEETDYFWNALTEGGTPSDCGWLKDKFGLSWQITPDVLPKLLGNPDREVARRVMGAMMKMQKIDIAKLEAARDGQ